MKRDLALKLLRTIIPNLDDDEDNIARIFIELQLLAEYKYNKYEMYHPGRLFLENLCLWLQRFDEAERADALAFVRNQLIFISREEFQQLSQLLYNDNIRRQQFEIAAKLAAIPQYRLKAIRSSPSFGLVTRASLYVGMSDGARLDFLRRHNLNIDNEQVLPYYAANEDKIKDCLQALRTKLNDPNALFQCLFMIDDFAGSGNTLLREVITTELPADFDPPQIPNNWKARVRFKKGTDGKSGSVEVLCRQGLDEGEISTLKQLDNNPQYQAAIESVIEKFRQHSTELKGSLQKVAMGGLKDVLHANAAIFFCPLLTTEHAQSRLQPLLTKLPGQFSKLKILTGALISSQASIVDTSSPFGALCEKYYEDELGDEHTGNVKFGYDQCGLPLVLHHNTPNNSLFLLWARRTEKATLFVRHERHGREAM